MTPSDVIKLLSEIEHADCDQERAHALEDDLFVEVLSAIAEGQCDNPAELARLALRSRDIEFDRWYA